MLSICSESSGWRARRIARALFVPTILVLSSALVYAAGSREPSSTAPQAGRIPVVAAENFYGDVASQIGGAKVAVTSILNNPNVDPHEYESSVNDAKSVANARLVIENGGGYDDWMGKLLSASPDPSRIVITAYKIAPVHLPENEHVFYNLDNMDAVAKAIRDSLSKLDPSSAPEFDRNYVTFVASLGPVRAEMAKIKSAYAGTPIGLTETIFLYQALPMDLKVLTPFAFQKAISEGNDPPADAAISAEQQVKEKQIRVLIYNEQTVTQITTRLEKEARTAGIPIIGVTETMPPADHYQSWILNQLEELQKALASSAG